MDLQDFLRQVRRYVRKNYPGLEAETVTIRFKDHAAVRFGVVGKKTACQVAGASEQMDEAEMQVFGVLPDADKPGIKALAVADKSGYKHNSWLLAILRRLRKKGKAVLKPDGYKKAT